MTKLTNGIAILSVLLAATIICNAQDDGRSLLRQVAKNNRDAVDAIALYPTETRKIIFEATEYPNIIAQLSTMQKNSQDAFEKQLSPLSKDEQEKIWNLTRYDRLIFDLTASSNLPADTINKILDNYPEDIRQTAIEEQKNHFDLLTQIDQMNKDFNADMEGLLNEYPVDVKNTFREMIKMPEVLSLLFDHMQYTVVIGEYYKKNPERVIHKTDSLNLVLTQKNIQESNDWKQSMNDNPEVEKQYVQAAQEYAQDNGYQPQEYDTPLTPDVTNYDTNSFNWWFGYPMWYPYNYWTPNPYWYDWGFYYGTGMNVVFFGLPSSYFMSWYFNDPEHCSKYAELSNHYYNYYNLHQQSINNNSISHGVNNWRIKNKDIVTDDWDKDNSNRVQRFKEYGQMEADRKNYNAKFPNQPVNQIEYLQKIQNKYPLISGDIVKNQSKQNNFKPTTVQEKTPEPARVPKVTVPDNYKVTSSKPANTNRNHPQSSPPPRQTPVNYNETPSRNSNQVRNAQEYQQNSWQQIQTQNNAPSGGGRRR